MAILRFSTQDQYSLPSHKLRAKGRQKQRMYQGCDILKKIKRMFAL